MPLLQVQAGAGRYSLSLSDRPLPRDVTQEEDRGNSRARETAVYTMTYTAEVPRRNLSPYRIYLDVVQIAIVCEEKKMNLIVRNS